MGALVIAGWCTTAGLAGVGTCGCVITWEGAGLANGGDKTAATPRDGFSREMGVYLGPCIMLPTPWTRVPKYLA